MISKVTFFSSMKVVDFYSFSGERNTFFQKDQKARNLIIETELTEKSVFNRIT